MSTKQPTKKELATQERERLRVTLLGLLKPGDEVRTILRHVSKSGMTRSVSVVINGEDYTYIVARLMNERMDNVHDGIKMGGAGMDMGFALVYNLSRYLWPHGYPCAGEGYDRCRSNDHANPGPNRDNYGPDVIHRDGYALKQRWL